MNVIPSSAIFNFSFLIFNYSPVFIKPVNQNGSGNSPANKHRCAGVRMIIKPLLLLTVFRNIIVDHLRAIIHEVHDYRRPD
jgi:hypothetical protein